ncbi:hypothetical protein ACFQ60_45630 [Streptomyces zhihengii]
MPTPEDIWADADLPARRLAGVALNPSSPEDVLLRLLAEAPPAARMVLCRDRILPDAVVEAVLRHPDTRTRSFFARNPHVDPAQRARLVDDPEWFVRAHLADAPRMPAGRRPRQLPDETAVHMLSTYDDELQHGGVYRQLSPGCAAACPPIRSRRSAPWGSACGATCPPAPGPRCWRTPTTRSGSGRSGTRRARIRRGWSASCRSGRATGAGTC